MSRFSIIRWRQMVERQSRQAPGKRRPRAGFRPARFAPRLEGLEDRTLPSTFTVMNLNDHGPGSLRAAVAAADANPGSTIDFAAGLHGTITLTGGPLNITSTTTINGPGANVLSVSGGHARRVFAVGAGTNVGISGLTIANGLSDQGGGIDNRGSLTLRYDTLSGNEALGDTGTSGIGGGVFNEAGASLNVDHGIFSGNYTVGNVGRGWGGGILNEGTASVTASTFTGNVSTGGSEPLQPDSTGGVGYGGGIASVYGSTLTVSNSIFTGNQSIDGLSTFNGSGGAIGSFLSSVTISDCTFTANQALANSTVAVGGAIRSVLDTAFSVTNSSFTGNQAIGFTKADGGAIDDEAETASVTDSTFCNNQAIGKGPGALSFGGAFENNLYGASGVIPSLTLMNCTLTGNEALGGAGGDGVTTFGFAQGGGIDSSGNVTLRNSVLMNNQSVDGAMAPGAPPRRRPRARRRPQHGLARHSDRRQQRLYRQQGRRRGRDKRRGYQRPGHRRLRRRHRGLLRRVGVDNRLPLPRQLGRGRRGRQRPTGRRRLRWRPRRFL